jgi:hypothetical protein
MKKNKKIRPFSLVKYNFDSTPKEWYSQLPFKKKDIFVFLGEILQVPDHGVFLNIKTNKIYSGYHLSEFLEVPEEET